MLLTGSEEEPLSELKILTIFQATGKEARSDKLEKEVTSHDVNLAPLPFLAAYARLGDYRLGLDAGPLNTSMQPVL